MRCFQQGRWLRAAIMAGICCFAPHATLAQHGGGGGGGRGGGGWGGGGGGGVFGRDDGGPPPRNMPDNGPAAGSGPVRGGLQLGPPGRWWDDKHFVKDLQLRPDQQRRMDETFEANRGVLLRRLQDFQGEEGRMETLIRARNPDESALFAQIDRLAQARAELEKANAHLVLQLRGEMDSDQLSRLEQHRAP